MEKPMSDTKPKLEAVRDEDRLDEDEKEFQALRQDVPGAKGASAAGIVAINVSKIPGKNEFFRTHPDFRPTVALVDHEEGIEKQFFAVTHDMVVALAGIGITVSNHTLYLTVTAAGAFRVVPVRQPFADGSQNEYARTKEVGLIQGITEWVRLYTDQTNKVYKVFTAPVGRFPDPVWPDLKPAKIFRLSFRDKGRLIDATEHKLFLQWAARGAND
jgi:hypothetical protein